MTEQITTAEIRTEILARLERAVRRDIEKDGDDLISAGLRSTTDIAEYFNAKVAVSKISRILDAMCLDGEIDWYGKIEGLGNVSFWRLALNEGDDGDGEPVDLNVGESNVIEIADHRQATKFNDDIDPEVWRALAA